jgi:hypothetical protein
MSLVSIHLLRADDYAKPLTPDTPDSTRNVEEPKNSWDELMGCLTCVGGNRYIGGMTSIQVLIWNVGTRLVM